MVTIVLYPRQIDIRYLHTQLCYPDHFAVIVVKFVNNNHLVEAGCALVTTRSLIPYLHPPRPITGQHSSHVTFLNQSGER